MKDSHEQITFSEFMTAARRLLTAIDLLVMEKGYDLVNEKTVSAKAGMPLKSIKIYFKSFDTLMQMHYDQVKLVQLMKVRLLNEKPE